jgi:hypothetical protein
LFFVAGLWSSKNQNVRIEISPPKKMADNFKKKSGLFISLNLHCFFTQKKDKKKHNVFHFSRLFQEGDVIEMGFEVARIQ